MVLLDNFVLASASGALVLDSIPAGGKEIVFGLNVLLLVSFAGIIFLIYNFIETVIKLMQES